jgi:hypothetical protein
MNDSSVSMKVREILNFGGYGYFELEEEVVSNAANGWNERSKYFVFVSMRCKHTSKKVMV